MGKVVFHQKVHTFQIDINGHVNNAVYVEWLEVGRTRLLEAVGRSVESMHERGYLPVLAETRIQYREPVFFPDTVRIEIWASELTHVTVWLEFQFVSERTGRLVAQAKQRGVFVDAKTNRPFRIKGEDREAFTSVLLPSEVKL